MNIDEIYFSVNSRKVIYMMTYFIDVNLLVCYVA